MKHLLIGLSNGLFITSYTGMPINGHTTGTTFEIQNSVIVSTTVVKNHGESLLIVLQEATFEPAESENISRSSITHVFSEPFGNTPKKDLQAPCFVSYKMSPLYLSPWDFTPSPI
jgi:hypothetical protein